MSDWQIERLSNAHQRGEFCSGKSPLDTFIQVTAGQYQKKRIGQTFVLVRPGEKRVWGYYTSAAGALSLEALPEEQRKKLPKHPVPTVHLGRLAVDKQCQGQKLGERLLFHFLHGALTIAEATGVFAVDVRAIDEESRSFYLKYGFIPLPDTPLHLFLPMKTVAGMFPA
jgi:ribosomal protein S18 acetylase RimI-like enzyme